MFQLFKKCEFLFISPLALDEIMHKIKTISNKQKLKNQEEKKHKDFCQFYGRIFNYINKNPLMKFIQFEKDLVLGIRNAIDNICIYDLKPHDAFHYAMIRDLGINCIVTKDKDFNKIKGLKIESF